MNPGFVLKGGAVVDNGRWFQADVRVRGSRIAEIGEDLKAGRREIEIDSSGSFIYPGLINSHEHLEFNLYSRLGEPPYANAYEWGNDLHRRWRTKIAEIEKIPLRRRLWWGAWKNLFSGVTRVVHHNPYYPYFRVAYPVEVLKRYTYAHSLRFDPNLQRALSRRKMSTPFIIHLAEGQDDDSRREVSQLEALGGIDERTVAVHALNISDEDIALLEKRRVSIVWCPSSNSYLFGRTTPIHSLYARIPVAIGTDSTISGAISLFEELQMAQKVSKLAADKLYDLVTSAPRSIFNLPRDAGAIVEGGRADLFVVSTNNMDPYRRLVSCDPGDIRLLVSSGQILMSDRERSNAKGFCLHLNGKEKVFNRSFSKPFLELKPHLSHFTYLM